MSTAATSLPRTASSPSLFERLRRFLRTPKGSLFAVFVPLLLVASSSVGLGAAMPHVAAAVAGACLIDLLVVRGLSGKWAWPSSALLSGMIVAFVLAPETPHVVTFVVGILASASKHILRTERGHLFNPAAIALVASIPLFATGQSWWGAVPDLGWPALVLMVLGGAFIVDRINKFPLVLAFTGTTFGLFTLVGLSDATRVAEMFREPFVQATLFLALFMLTDPPTSPGRYSDQIWIGVLVGAVSCIAQLAGVGQSYLLVGLLIGNAALAARRWATGRVARPVAATPGRPRQLAAQPVATASVDRRLPR